MTAAEYQRQGFPGKRRGPTPETALKNACKQYLALQGWDSLPLTAGLGSVPGMPDRLAMRAGRVVALEFKRPGGKLSPAQEAMQARWEAAGCTYLVVRSVEDLYVLGGRQEVLMEVSEPC